VAAGCGPAPADEQLEPIVQTCRELLGAEQVESRGGQFNGERNAVQLATDLRDQREIRLGQTELGCGRDGPVNKETHSLVLHDALAVQL
jgi:hypothetical protein